VIGRQGVQWHSKKDAREVSKDITDPEQSLRDAYPNTQNKGVEVKKHCFCCKKGDMKWQ
jgi:hypothetical protein